MPELKAIQVQGEMTLIFDKDYGLSQVNTPAVSIDDFLNALIDKGQFTEEEKAGILQMSVGDFTKLCREAAGRTSEGIPEHEIPSARVKVPKRIVMLSPGKVSCPTCGAVSLRISDGFLKCLNCGADFGDIDLLPELF